MKAFPGVFSVFRVGLSLCTLCVVATVSAAEESVEYGEVKKLGDLSNPKINESSGVAASFANKGILFTHNDSGDHPQFYAIDLTGKHVGTFHVFGAQAIDWEDMCAFHRDGKNCLILADVGDNNATREFVTLYIVEEPRLTDRQIRLLQKIDYTYEGGPQNCEAVAYDPIEGEVILIAKTFDIQCRAFALKLPAVGAEGNRRLKAKLLGEITSPMVTALDISRDGKRAIVLTYKHAYDYVRKEGESWGQALAGRPQKIKLPHRKQGEAITYGTDGKTLYTTSEQLTAPLLMVPVR